MHTELDVDEQLLQLADYYSKKVTPSQIQDWAKDLPAEPRRVAMAIQRYKNNKTNTWFPLPSVLKALMPPQRLYTAFCKLCEGGTWISQRGCRVVMRCTCMGGYQALANSFDERDPKLAERIRRTWAGVNPHYFKSGQEKLSCCATG